MEFIMTKGIFGRINFNLPFQGEDRWLVTLFPGRCHRAEIIWAFSPKKFKSEIELK
jgi:hypothetical protein